MLVHDTHHLVEAVMVMLYFIILMKMNEASQFSPLDAMSAKPMLKPAHQINVYPDGYVVT